MFGRWTRHETLLDPDDVAAGHGSQERARAAVPVTWTLLGLALLIDLLGEFRLVDRTVAALSPFVRTLAPLTVGEGLAVALAVLAAVAGGLATVGLAGLAMRDVSEA